MRRICCTTKTLAISAWADQQLILWEVASGREVRCFAGYRSDVLGGGVQACAFSPDGRWVLSGAWDCTLKRWEASTGQEVGSWEVGWPVYAVAFHSVTPHLVIVVLRNGTLALLDLSESMNGASRP